ncbi:MAG: aspartate--ammonia ligase, partial [Candidatus Bathyarchaeota archaeon]|nr:aspartate--ammonia ligase [Candidatus Bathyarchaeota archaeon]
MTFSPVRLKLPKGYRSHLNLKETEEAIKYIKDSFQTKLCRELNLKRVSAPIVVLSRTGINDNLTGIENPISFNVTDIEERAEIVQSLAKWKRMALADYSFKCGEGLYTDMNAIRPDESLDNLHSIYVDQWDWERIITREERNLEFLKYIVQEIYEVMIETEKEVCQIYKQIPGPFLPEQIHFIHSEELEERLHGLTPREREDAICKEVGVVFIIGIGAKLKSVNPHDGRAADYDDWSTKIGKNKRGLNGDILIWYPLLNSAMELSSMGIRVDKESLLRQLKIKGELNKVNLYFHQRLLKGELPFAIGGGIGQSRLCMFFLRKAHIGGVQSSIWPDE